MLRFYVEQAEQLARWGQLRLSFLEAGAQPIAFAYGINAKGIYHSIKCGYDGRFATYSPGQLLRHHMFEAFCADPQCRAVDCLGPITGAHRRWRPTTYALGLMIVSPGRLLGRMALRAYKSWRPYVRRLRGEQDALPATAEPQRQSLVTPRQDCSAPEDPHCATYSRQPSGDR